MWIVNQISEEPVAFQAIIQSALSLVIGFELIPGFTQDKMGLLLAELSPNFVDGLRDQAALA